MVAPVAAPVADGGLLVNVLGDINFTSTAPSQTVTPGAEEGFRKFLFKNNGVLFENDILQIGVKSEYKKNLGRDIASGFDCFKLILIIAFLGRIAVFYGNKSSVTLQNFTTTLCANPDLEDSLFVDVKPTPPTIEGGAQKQQLIDVECKNIFAEAPTLEIKFKCVSWG